MNNLAASYSSYGEPGAVLKLENRTVPVLSSDEVLIKMLLAPINPSDLNRIEGTYGIKDVLPCIAGGEGVGRIEKKGHLVNDLEIGHCVLPPVGVGTWQQWVVCRAAECLTFPQTLAPEKAAMLYVNPATAWRMLHDFFALKPNEWILQNSANSAVGRSVIQIAKFLKLRTINLVRRPELIPELTALGADAVFLDQPETLNVIKDLVGHAQPRLALNAVGGESIQLLSRAVAPSAKIITYGAMAKQPLRIGNGNLIFKDLSFHGYWISNWYKKASRAEVASMFNCLAELFENGSLQLPIAATYPLEQIHEAVIAAQKPHKSGKIFVKLN